VNFGEVKSHTWIEFANTVYIFSQYWKNSAQWIHCYEVKSILLCRCRYVTVSSSDPTVKCYYTSAQKLQIHH